MMKVFLFPRSTYLSTHWWHRLATVIFWFWFVFVLAFCWHELIVKPFTSCIETNVQYEIHFNKPSGLDCGPNAVAYAIQDLKNSSTLEVVGGFLIFTIVLYIALAIPSLLYRLGLYIAKGDSWRNEITST